MGLQTLGPREAIDEKAESGTTKKRKKKRNVVMKNSFLGRYNEGRPERAKKETSGKKLSVYKSPGSLKAGSTAEAANCRAIRKKKKGGGGEREKWTVYNGNDLTEREFGEFNPRAEPNKMNRGWGAFWERKWRGKGKKGSQQRGRARRGESVLGDRLQSDPSGKTSRFTIVTI